MTKSPIDGPSFRVGRTVKHKITYTVIAWTEPPGSTDFNDFVPRMSQGHASMSAARMWAKLFGCKSPYFTGGITIYKEHEDHGEIVASYEIKRPTP